jgi:hypothetical protein
MTLPTWMYGNPEGIVMGLQRREIGCHACEWSRRVEGKWGCAWGKNGYPDRSRNDCQEWKRK